MAKQILVVDDDALMRRSLSLQLEQAGYAALPWPDDVRAALEALITEPPAPNRA